MSIDAVRLVALLVSTQEPLESSPPSDPPAAATEALEGEASVAPPEADPTAAEPEDVAPPPDVVDGQVEPSPDGAWPQAQPVAPLPLPEPPRAAYRAPRHDFVHRGGFLRPSAGFAMCTSELCNEIPTGFGGSLSGGYRFPWVGVGALVMGSGGRTNHPSALRGPLERVGMSFLFVGALAQLVPVRTGRVSPTLDLGLGYLRLIEWGRIGSDNIFAIHSRVAVAVGGSLDIHVSRRVAMGPSFHYLFPFAGQQCNDIDYDADGNYREAETRDCSSYRDRHEGWERSERRALRRDTTRAWLASIGVTVHLGEPRRRVRQ